MTAVQCISWLRATRQFDLEGQRDRSRILYDRLVGLVVKASALRADGPGFESRLRRDLFGVESYQ